MLLIRVTLCIGKAMHSPRKYFMHEVCLALALYAAVRHKGSVRKLKLVDRFCWNVVDCVAALH